MSRFSGALLAGCMLLGMAGAHAGETANGLGINGVSSNGIHINGLRTNGVTLNRLAFNGAKDPLPAGFNGIALAQLGIR